MGADGSIVCKEGRGNEAAVGIACNGLLEVIDENEEQ
jgi:hypothetical protein